MQRLNPYLTKTKLDEISHAGAFQKAQPSGSFGATSGKSFAQRQQAERNRRIASYRHSKLVLDQYSNRELYAAKPVVEAPNQPPAKNNDQSGGDRFKNLRQSGAINQQASAPSRAANNFYSGISPEIGR